MIWITLAIFIFITLFHVYMGLGLPFKKAAVLPIIKGKPMPFHSLAAWPVAIALALSTISFAHSTGITGPLQYSALFDLYLWVTGIGLLMRGIGGFVFFHLLNLIIDATEFKTWDLKLYSPLTVYLGAHCILVLISL